MAQVVVHSGVVWLQANRLAPFRDRAVPPLAGVAESLRLLVADL